jgi:hypothetical protein
MSARRLKQRTERGSIILVAMLVLVALVSLGGLTTLSVQGGLASSGHDRFRAIALYAAESGAAMGMDYLRRRVESTGGWSAFVNANNSPIESPVDLPGNNVQPGQAGNPLSPELKAWYQVEIRNNVNDPGFAGGTDDDNQVILRVTGYGPNGTMAQIEWDVRAGGTIGLGRPCPTYAQGNIDADGAGLNECMGSISNTVSAFSLN